jgi:hypothetical protein
MARKKWPELAVRKTRDGRRDTTPMILIPPVPEARCLSPCTDLISSVLREAEEATGRKGAEAIEFQSLAGTPGPAIGLANAAARV